MGHSLPNVSLKPWSRYMRFSSYSINIEGGDFKSLPYIRDVVIEVVYCFLSICYFINMLSISFLSFSFSDSGDFGGMEEDGVQIQYET